LVTRDKILADLRASRLLSQAQLLELESETGRNPHVEPHEIVSWLVDRNLITRWQAKMLLSGQTAFFLGKYKLIKELGHGGMGAVFQAQQAPLGRMVALKVMAQKLLHNQAAVARFQREIQATAALHHPNIVTAFDADQVQNTHFLVMEYVAGESLDELLKREKRLPIPTACEYIRQAALGLQHAYEQRMAHRDIKPSNLLISHTSDGEPLVKILDMGLARFTSETREAGELTSTGQILGTPDYIAPEQAKNTKGADIRSDIFSLGCTLFRALTGRIPFGGESIMEKLSSRLLDDAPRLRTVLPEAPSELEAVVEKMLARDPAQRYQTPAEVATALEPFAGTKSEAHPSPPPVSPTAELTPNDFSAGPDLAVNQFLEDLRHEAILEGVSDTRTTHEHAGVDTLGHAEAPAPLKKRTMRGALEDRRNNQKKREIVAAAAIAVVLAAGIAYWAWEEAGQATLIVEWPESERSQATLVLDGIGYSPQKKGPLRYRVSPGRRTIKLKREGYDDINESLLLTRGEERHFKPDWQVLPQTARKISWETLRDRARTIIGRLKSFDGVEAAVDDPEIVRLRSDLVRFHRTHPGTKEAIETARLMRRLPWPVDRLRRETIGADVLRRAGHGDSTQAPAEIVAILGDSRIKMWGRGSSVALSPNGSIIASVGQYEAFIYLWDGESGDLLRKLPVRGGPTCVTFSGDGTRIACGGLAAFVWDTTSGELVAELPQSFVTSVALNRDGTMLAAVGDNFHVIQLWNVNLKTVLWKRSDQANQFLQVSLSADGQFVAYNTPGGAIEVRDVTGGALLRQIPNDPYVPSRLADGGSLLFLGTDGNKVQCWKTNPWMLRNEFGANGQTFAAIDRDGTRCLTHSTADLAVWNTSTGERVWLQPAGNNLFCGDMSRDGMRIAIADRFGGIQVWDALTGKRAIAMSGPLSAMLSVRASPDGSGVAGGNADGTVWRWAFGRRDALYVAEAHPGGGIVLGFTADGRALISAAADDRIRMWDDATGVLRDVISTKNRFAGHVISEFLNALAVSPDDRYVASTEGQEWARVMLLDRETRKEIMLAGHKPGVDALAFGPNGAQLASGGRNEPTIRLWDVRSGREQQTLNDNNAAATGGVQCLAFDPLSTALYAGGSAFGTDVTVWDPQTRLKSATWQGHGQCVEDIAVSPDGRTVATTSLDGTVITWNPHAKWGHREQTIQIAPEAGAVFDMDFTPDGRHLVTANGNGTIYVLRLNAWSPVLDSDER